jgi:hypothetical protein
MLSKINQTDSRSGFLKGSVLVLGVFSSVNCIAEEWYIQPSFSLRTEYDDNKRLLTDRFVRNFRANEQENGRSGDLDLSAYGIITTAEAKAGVRSDYYEVSFKGKVAVKKYFSDFDFDSEDFFLDLNSRYDITQRNSVGFSASYDQESTLTAELDDTGLTQDNVPRTTWKISPYWIFNLSETKFLQASYLHQDVSYEQSTTTRFSDYIYDVVSLTFSHQWNEKLTNSTTASWTKIKYPSLKREEEQYSINGSLDYKFSDTWTASLSGGVQYTQTEGEQLVDSVSLIPTPFISSGPDGPIPLGSGEIGQVIDGRVFRVGVNRELQPFSDSQTAFVFSFGTEKQFETGHIGASYSRSSSPTGQGSLRTVDRFSVDYLHKITEHLHFLLDGQVHITKATLNENSSRFSNQDRTYYSVTPTLRWKFNRQLSLSGGYRYRRQEFETTNNNANTNNTESVGESNSVFFTLKYQWDKFTTQEF